MLSVCVLMTRSVFPPLQRIDSWFVFWSIREQLICFESVSSCVLSLLVGSSCSPFFFLLAILLYEIQPPSFFCCSFLFEISLCSLGRGRVRRGFLRAQLQSSLFCHFWHMALSFVALSCHPHPSAFTWLKAPLSIAPAVVSCSICSLFPAFFMSGKELCLVGLKNS